MSFKPEASVERLRSYLKAKKQNLDATIKLIMKNPLIGEMKLGDLSVIRVYKFKMVQQLTLLAYHYEDQTITLTLRALGSHENFYRDLKS